MSALTIGDRVKVTRTRVHIHPGTVVGILPRRVRVEFATGGYGGSAYIEDFYPDQLTTLAEPAAAVTDGQIWQRKPAGYLYRVEHVNSGAGSNIELVNLHDQRHSHISTSGLRTKFLHRTDLEQAGTTP